MRHFRFIERTKELLREALRSGKIIHIGKLRECNGYDFTNARRLNDEEWLVFEEYERYFRKTIAGKEINIGDFICNDFEKWLKIVKNIHGLFIRNGVFIDNNLNIYVLKFCNRVLNKFPVVKVQVVTRVDLLANIASSLKYINETILPYFSKKSGAVNNEIVSRAKLTDLWIHKRKKAIRIIENDCKWPVTIVPEISVVDTENYYKNMPKYVIKEEFVPTNERFFNVRHECVDNIQLFRPEEIGTVVQTCPDGKSCGDDGVTYEDVKSNWEEHSLNITGIVNTITINLKWPVSWKHAVIQRIPKKNFDINDLTTLRDISLLPVLYKIFSKCLCVRITPSITEKISFWQRAYLESRDRQELIFSLKTAIDDLKHMSTKLHLVFIDFSDAFGSVDHSCMFKVLQEFEVPLPYCILIEDLYKHSNFQVMVGHELSNTFNILRGTKTGDPLSGLIFIAVVDYIFKPMVVSAMLDLNIRDQRRLNPIPVQGFADDVCLAAYQKQVMDNMLRSGEPRMDEAGMEAKVSKCNTLYGRRSGNNWYTGRGDTPPEFILQGKVIPLNRRNEPYPYLGKSLSIEGECAIQINEFCEKYKTLIDKICLCSLPLSLKCSALNNMALAKILHHFCNTRLKEGQLKDLDNYLAQKVRSLYKLYTTTTRLIIYLPRINGGLGVKKLSHVYYITRICFLLKMLNHDEVIFSEIARNSLCIDMRKRGVPLSNGVNNYLGHEVKEDGFLRTTTKYGCDSDWHDLQLYSKKLGVLLQWHDNKAALVVGNDHYIDNTKVNKVLKSLLLKRQLEKAMLLSLQGSFFNLNLIDNKNSHCIYYNWKLSDELIIFLVKARLNILPTNFTLHIWDRQKDPICPLCRHPSESIAHLLNSCRRFQNFRSRRHDRLVSKLCEFIKSGQHDCEVHENKMATTIFPALREELQTITHRKPDIIYIDQNRNCTIVEVTVCYDLYMSFAYEAKVRIYTPLITLLRQRGYNTKLVVLCFGSLGTVEKSVFKSLMCFNNDKNVVKSTIKWCSVSVIIMANYIWRYRLRFINEQLLG